MKRGRPAKPKAQKLIEGTYREDRDYGGLPAPVLESIPEPPQHLGQGAKRYFLNICQVLLEMNNLSLSDLVVITQLAQNLEINEMAYESCKDGGYEQVTQNGYGAVTAAFTVYNQTSKTIRELSNLLGLNPSARERIKVKPKENEDNELTKILES